MYILSQEEEYLLRMAQRQLDSPYIPEEFDGFFPVHKSQRGFAQNLAEYGLLERHENKRKKWYRLTSEGQVRLAADTIPVKAAPEASTERYARLLQARVENFNLLQRDMAAQGFMLLPEAGRGPYAGEIAFYELATGQKRLFRCRLGTATWSPASGSGYYSPVRETPDDDDEIPF